MYDNIIFYYSCSYGTLINLQHLAKKYTLRFFYIEICYSFDCRLVEKERIKATIKEPRRKVCTFDINL